MPVYQSLKPELSILLPFQPPTLSLESYSHELASSLTPVHKDVGTLASFSLHPGGDAAALAHYPSSRAIECIASRQQPSIHIISYLIDVIEI
ncbi:hypothetical protein L195_g060942 [Trifolium pratense]|uniref:Uncharacterized protein n=1 Tax=Trifolium pratense TaxID=57577 RepID=A0A2K3K6U9_TRIPR|nr:hypothetical protein L195_g060942 [Trifolium pratense]